MLTRQSVLYHVISDWQIKNAGPSDQPLASCAVRMVAWNGFWRTILTPFLYFTQCFPCTSLVRSLLAPLAMWLEKSGKNGLSHSAWWLHLCPKQSVACSASYAPVYSKASILRLLVMFPQKTGTQVFLRGILLLMFQKLKEQKQFAKW